ncbi:hypothetical protein [Gordonia sp. OPL2]|uniref:hypothetical protein n=1 Tax=Gordonia sp. OPL2 TaxID=2486274 RepID=UPI001655F1B6|nr:hypothetical protein [Gordonia sp. OPL2]ROZ88065.1 hypothetical protein EEB19_22250 [Gordonia sp. OPL2]
MAGGEQFGWLNEQWPQWMPLSYSVAVAGQPIGDHALTGSQLYVDGYRRYPVDDIGAEIRRTVGTSIDGTIDVIPVAGIDLAGGGGLLVDALGLCASGSFLRELAADSIVSIYLSPSRTSPRVQWFDHGQPTAVIYNQYPIDDLAGDDGPHAAVRRAGRAEFIGAAMALAHHVTGVAVTRDDFGAGQITLARCRAPWAYP